MLNLPDEKGIQLVAANIVAGQTTERYFEKIVTFAQTNEKRVLGGTDKSSYFLHEFRGEVLIFQAMNVLTMFSPTFHNFLLSLTCYNMVTISHPYFATSDCFHIS